MKKALAGILCVGTIATSACSTPDTWKRFQDEAAQHRPSGTESASQASGTTDPPKATAPPANPIPERVTIIAPLPERGLAAGPHAFRQKRSVWQDGEVHINGTWEAFYVWTSGVTDQCAVGTATLADPNWYREYPCPEPIGQLTITGIDQSGLVLSFLSTDQVTGTFNLHTQEWTLSPSVEDGSPVPRPTISEEEAIHTALQGIEGEVEPRKVTYLQNWRPPDGEQTTIPVWEVEVAYKGETQPFGVAYVHALDNQERYWINRTHHGQP